MPATGLPVDLAPPNPLLTNDGARVLPPAQGSHRISVQYYGYGNLRRAGEELAAHLTAIQDSSNDREQELEGVRKELVIILETMAFKANKALLFWRFRSSENSTTSEYTTALKFNMAEPNVVGLSRPKPGNNFLE